MEDNIVGILEDKDLWFRELDDLPPQAKGSKQWEQLLKFDSAEHWADSTIHLYNWEREDMENLSIWELVNSHMYGKLSFRLDFEGK